jgi:hypothetical protein
MADIDDDCAPLLAALENDLVQLRSAHVLAHECGFQDLVDEITRMISEVRAAMCLLAARRVSA